MKTVKYFVRFEIIDKASIWPYKTYQRTNST